MLAQSNPIKRQALYNLGVDEDVFLHDVGEILNTLERVSSSNIARTSKSFGNARTLKVVWQRAHAHMRRDAKKMLLQFESNVIDGWTYFVLFQSVLFDEMW